MIGDAGQIRCDLVSGDTRLFRGDEKKWEVFNRTVDPNDEYVRELEHFMKCIDGRARPPVGAAEGARALALALAVKASMKSGKPVRFARGGRP
jgi:predicted dehydrogenase